MWLESVGGRIKQGMSEDSRRSLKSHRARRDRKWWRQRGTAEQEGQAPHADGGEEVASASVPGRGWCQAEGLECENPAL